MSHVPVESRRPHTRQVASGGHPLRLPLTRARAGRLLVLDVLVCAVLGLGALTGAVAGSWVGDLLGASSGLAAWTGVALLAYAVGALPVALRPSARGLGAVAVANVVFAVLAATVAAAAGLHLAGVAVAVALVAVPLAVALLVGSAARS